MLKKPSDGWVTIASDGKQAILTVVASDVQFQTTSHYISTDGVAWEPLEDPFGGKYVDGVQVKSFGWMAESMEARLEIWVSTDGRYWENLDIPVIGEPSVAGSSGFQFVVGIFFGSTNNDGGARTMWVGTLGR